VRDPHRAFVVAMFVDMTDFRSFAETADPEVLFATLQHYHQLVGEAVDASGGQVIDFAGDGIFAVFNDRVPLPSPELTAVSTAIALRDSFDDVAARWAREGAQLGIKFGLDAGHATLGRIGYEGHWAYGAIGRVVINAALISRRARNRQIFASERVVSAIEGHVVVSPVEDVTDPKLSRPLRIVEVTAAGVPA